MATIAERLLKVATDADSLRRDVLARPNTDVVGEVANLCNVVAELAQTVRDLNLLLEVRNGSR